MAELAGEVDGMTYRAAWDLDENRIVWNARLQTKDGQLVGTRAGSFWLARRMNGNFESIVRAAIAAAIRSDCAEWRG